MQRDVTMLIDSNEEFQKKLEKISGKTIAFEYRIRAVEKNYEDGYYENMESFSN